MFSQGPLSSQCPIEVPLTFKAPRSSHEAPIRKWVIHQQFTVRGTTYIIHFEIHNTIFITNDGSLLILPFLWFDVNIVGKLGGINCSFSMTDRSDQMSV